MPFRGEASERPGEAGPALLAVAAGEASGARWGALLSLTLLSPLLGAALGGKLSSARIDGQFMRDVVQRLDSGHAALFLLIRKMTVDK